MEVSQNGLEKENVPSYFSLAWFEDELEETPRMKPLTKYVPFMMNDCSNKQDEEDDESFTVQQDVSEYKHFIHETGEVFAVLENVKYEYIDNAVTSEITAKEELLSSYAKDESLTFSLVSETKIQDQTSFIESEEVQSETANNITNNHSEPDKSVSDLYSCIKCSQSFPSEEDFQKHHRAETGSCLYKCYMCDKMFTCKKNLSRHLLLHTGNLPHKCDQCDKSYLDKCSLKRHALLHTESRLLTCDECRKTYSRRHDYNLHILAHSRAPVEHKCDICDKKYINKHNLKRHKLAAHSQ